MRVNLTCIEVDANIGGVDDKCIYFFKKYPIGWSRVCSYFYVNILSEMCLIILGSGELWAVNHRITTTPTKHTFLLLLLPGGKNFFLSEINLFSD